jgi:hypothetical protein
MDVATATVTRAAQIATPTQPVTGWPARARRSTSSTGKVLALAKFVPQSS